MVIQVGMMPINTHLQLNCLVTYVKCYGYLETHPMNLTGRFWHQSHYQRTGNIEVTLSAIDLLAKQAGFMSLAVDTGSLDAI